MANTNLVECWQGLEVLACMYACAATILTVCSKFGTEGHVELTQDVRAAVESYIASPNGGIVQDDEETTPSPTDDEEEGNDEVNNCEEMQSDAQEVEEDDDVAENDENTQTESRPCMCSLLTQRFHPRRDPRHDSIHIRRKEN